MKNTQTKSKLLSTVLPTLILISGLYIAQYTNQAHAFCDETSSFLDRACKTVQDTWTQGEHSVYLPLHTYHLRSAYTPEKINSFNENTFGIGYGRTAFD